MKLLLENILRITLLCTCSLSSASVLAQSPITLDVNMKIPGLTIPEDFVGVSFGPINLQPLQGGGYVFDSTNTQALTLFRQLGIKYFRMGGNWVDTNSVGYIPSRIDIDALFRFVKSANVKVAYTLRLLDGDSLQDASTAKYIWDKYRQYLDCFAIGNEPNLYGSKDPEITSFSTYLAKWRRFVAAVLDSVPNAKFGGPDDATNTTWASNFAYDEKGSGIVTSVFSHYYVGGNCSAITAQQVIDGMLSSTWDNTNYPNYYNGHAALAFSDGLSFRLTEANSYTAVGNGTNEFCSALFILDFMHWWAEHGCSGVCVHTWVPTSNGVIYEDPQGNYHVYPIGYGIKAFAIGGHGTVFPVSLSNPSALDLTGYACGDTDSLYVTIINKEHGTGGRDAEVTISAPGLPRNALVMYLTAPDGNAAATSGVTLGGASIPDTGSWQGKWMRVDSAMAGTYVLKVPATSAAIVKIGGTVTSLSERPNLPESLVLQQNFPNPFNPSTAIKYSLPKAQMVTLKVYNVLGEQVTTLVNAHQTPGYYSVVLDGNRLASGIYFYILRTDNFSSVHKMMLLK